MRLRTLRRRFTRLLDKSGDRKIAEYRKRADELGNAFRELNRRIPALNEMATAAGEDPLRLANALRAMSANHLAGSAILSEWANVCESASKLTEER
jgi:hypothetical protein